MPGSAALTPASGAGPEARRVPRAPRPGDAAPAATRHGASRTSLQSTQPHKDGGEAAKAVPCPRRSVDVGPFEATQGKRVRTRLVHPPAAGTSPQSQGEDGRRAGSLSQRPGRLDVKGHDPTKILGCPGSGRPPAVSSSVVPMASLAEGAERHADSPAGPIGGQEDVGDPGL